MSLRHAALGLLTLGVLLMVPFDAWFTRGLGVVCLFGFVICGLFAVATPDYLGRDDETETTPTPGAET